MGTDLGNSEAGKDAGRKARLRALVALALFSAIGAGLLLADAAQAYLWVKALHVIAVMSWMAGLLYMPRLFIYHSDAPRGSTQAATFAVMEQRLMRLIMRPAMVLSWIFGLYLAWTAFGFQGGWLHAKLAAVLALTGVNEYFAAAARAFHRGDYVRSPRFWRMVNEIPTLLMIVSVVLVIVKPF